MAIVSEKMNPRPPPTATSSADPRSSGRRPVPDPTASLGAQTSNLSLESANKDDGFFGSFFSSKKPTKKSGVLEPPPAVLKASGTLSERETMETEVIKLLIQSYYGIVKRTVSDLVPKAIMLNLVVNSKENMQRELLQELYSKRDLVEESMKESELVVERRRECKKMIEALQKADELIAQV